MFAAHVYRSPAQVQVLSQNAMPDESTDPNEQ